MENPDNLDIQILPKLNELIGAFTTPEFYVEMLMIILSVALAAMISALAVRHLKQHFQVRPPSTVNPELILRPLVLLTPVLTVLYLSIMRPFAERYGDQGFWIDAAVQLVIAYLMAKVVMLVVKSKLVAYFIVAVITVLAVLKVTGFLDVTNAYLNSMAFQIGQVKLSMLNLVNGVIILVIVFWVAGALTSTLETYLRRSSSLSYNARELTVKFVKLLIYFIAILITLSTMGVDLTAFAVFGGALGVGIGLGLQKITANFVSGITILMEKSIQIGDLVELSGSADAMLGWVRQLNIRYTLLETFDGREILIPNEELASTRVTNWTHSNYLARIEIKVGVSYDADPKKVTELLLEAAQEHPLCLKEPKPNCFLREFGDSSLNFLLFFWIPDVREGRLKPQSEVMMTILKKFTEAGISIPYPQRSVHVVSQGLA